MVEYIQRIPLSRQTYSKTSKFTNLYCIHKFVQLARYINHRIRWKKQNSHKAARKHALSFAGALFAAKQQFANFTFVFIDNKIEEIRFRFWWELCV